jgi:hypothetical protein
MVSRSDTGYNLQVNTAKTVVPGCRERPSLIAKSHYENGCSASTSRKRSEMYLPSGLYNEQRSAFTQSKLPGDLEGEMS